MGSPTEWCKNEPDFLSPTGGDNIDLVFSVFLSVRPSLFSFRIQIVVGLIYCNTDGIIMALCLLRQIGVFHLETYPCSGWPWMHTKRHVCTFTIPKLWPKFNHNLSEIVYNDEQLMRAKRNIFICTNT